VKRYPKYKESGQSWVGQVPAHWELKPNRSLFRDVGQTVENKGEGVLLLSLTQNGLIPRDMENPTGKFPADFSTYQKVKTGDLVFCLFDVDETPRTVGISSHEGMITGAYTVVRCYDENHAKYLYWFYLSLDEAKRLKPLYRGLRKVVPAETFRSIKSPIPPRDEAVKICNFIESQVDSMNKAISSQERMIELLKERIDSLVLRAISRQKVRFSRIGHIAELISRPIESDPAESYVKLGLYNWGRGLFHKDESNQDEMGESDFFYVRPGDLIISGQFAWEGAVAIAGPSEDGSVVSHRYPILRGLSGVAETEYLLAFLCTEYGNFLLNEHSRGAAGRNRPLNIKSLLKEKIPLPALEVQMEIVEAIKQRQAILMQINKLNLKLKERRSAIITQAVTGQIDVR
jgi:type I restriction enzyme S subunit